LALWRSGSVSPGWQRAVRAWPPTNDAAAPYIIKPACVRHYSGNVAYFRARLFRQL